MNPFPKRKLITDTDTHPALDTDTDLDTDLDRESGRRPGRGTGRSSTARLRGGR